MTTWNFQPNRATVPGMSERSEYPAGCPCWVTNVVQDLPLVDGAEAAASLQHFLQERWKGVHPILYGDQLRQARLDDWIFQGLLDVEHLPA